LQLFAINTVGKVFCAANPGKQAKTSLTRMFGYQCKDSLISFIKEAGKQSPRPMENHLAGASLPGGFTDGYSTYAGGKAPVEHFTPRGRPRKFFHARGLCEQPSEQGPMDSPFFYGQEPTERWAFQQIPGDGQTNQPRLRYCFRL